MIFLNWILSISGDTFLSFGIDLGIKFSLLFANTFSRDMGKIKAIVGPSRAEKGKQKQKPRTWSSVAANTSPSSTPPIPVNTKHPFLQFTIPDHLE